MRLRLFTPWLLGGLVALAVMGITVAAAAAFAVTSAKVTLATGTPTSATCTLVGSQDATNVVADAYVDQAVPNTNLGSATHLDVQPDFLLSLVHQERRAFVKWDLSGCNFPTGTIVTSATVTVTEIQAPATTLGGVQQRPYSLYRVTGSWTESGIAWNNQPTVVSSATASFTTATTVPTAFNLTVTADVSSFVAGTATNQGWRINDTGGSQLLSQPGQFASRENVTALNHPKLVVNYSY
jgi:hypothetical protein